MHTSRLTRYLLVAVAIVVLSPAMASASSSVVLPSEAIVPSVDRISWAAIFAGAIVALATHMALSALGIGIGAAILDPYSRKDPANGAPTTVMVWMFISGLVSLFAGGWVAGRLAGTVPFDSAIHGVITWSFATVAMFVLASTSLGFVVGGAFHMLKSGITGVAKTAAAIVPGAVHMAEEAVANNVPKLDWKAIESEAKTLLKHGKNEESSEESINELLKKAYGTVRDGVNSEDREALVGVITEKTNVTREDANKTLEKWEKMYKDAKQKYDRVLVEAEQTARKTADVTTTAISRIACWTFASLAFGAVVAGLGGNFGSTYFRL